MPVVQQLTGVDGAFLAMETPTQQGHVGGVVTLDPSTAPDGFGYESIRRVVEERIHLLPPFRRRLVTVPFDLDQPYWIEDPDFDLDFHLRHIAVPAPGGPEQLADLVARIHARHLDRSRPLWELYVIEGLASGRVATYTKLHHAAIDGVSGAEILTILLDPTPDGREVPASEKEWKPDRHPGQLELLGRTAFGTALRPAKAMRFAYDVTKSVPALKPLSTLPALLGLGRDDPDVLSRPSLLAPRTVLNGALTAHRRWAYGTVALDQVKAVKNRHGVTVNDVVISITAGAIRRWLLEYADVPERSLQAMIPISIRTEEQRRAMGNAVSAMIAPIGTHLDDPVERLQFVNRTMSVAKERFQATPATMLQDFAQFTPPAVAARAARLVFKKGRVGRVTPFNTVISNIPGPDFPLYLAGARLEGHFPVSTIVEGSALNVTLHRYLGDLCFGVVADRSIVHDVWSIMRSIGEELDLLGAEA
jgi:WS/DGAT/MGAT family acyltransferase